MTHELHLDIEYGESCKSKLIALILDDEDDSERRGSNSQGPKISKYIKEHEEWELQK